MEGILYNDLYIHVADGRYSYLKTFGFHKYFPYLRQRIETKLTNNTTMKNLFLAIAFLALGAFATVSAQTSATATQTPATATQTTEQVATKTDVTPVIATAAPVMSCHPAATAAKTGKGACCSSANSSKACCHGEAKAGCPETKDCPKGSAQCKEHAEKAGAVAPVTK